jgi:hypothetical protein
VSQDYLAAPRIGRRWSATKQPLPGPGAQMGVHQHQRLAVVAGLLQGWVRPFSGAGRSTTIGLVSEHPSCAIESLDPQFRDVQRITGRITSEGLA